MPVPDMIYCNTCSISASFVGFPKKAHRNKTGTFCAQTPSHYRSAGTAVLQQLSGRRPFGPHITYVLL